MGAEKERQKLQWRNREAPHLLVDTLDGTLEGETHKIGPGTHCRCAWVRDGACIGGYSLVAVLVDVSHGVL